MVRFITCMTTVVLGAVTLSAWAEATAPKEITLWPDGAPGALGSEPTDTPILRIWQPSPDKDAHVGVVICPGGGYSGLSEDLEGKQVADWGVEQGITCFMLRSRLAPKYHHPAPLQDANRAVRWVRSHASDYGLDPKRIGIWGFSAGGHLASTAATHYDLGNPNSTDPVEKVSSRPDFTVLAYPVISMKDGLTHGGSKKNLLGDQPDPKLVELLSNETQVTPDTPPTFIFHTAADTAVLPENAIAFFTALRKANVPVEMHIYEKGRHGVGMGYAHPEVAGWPNLVGQWLRSREILPQKSP
jgi:acetyl esterase/lipase